MKHAHVPVLLASLLVMSACKASRPTEPTLVQRPPELAVRYPSSGTQLVQGFLFATFEAYVVDPNGVYTDVTQTAIWTSSSPAVLGPLSGGRPDSSNFFPYSVGTAEIRATHQGLSASLTVTVAGPATPPFLRILPSGIQGTPSLNVTYVPNQSGNNTMSVSDRVSWTSMNPQIGFVQNGRFLPVTPGNVELRASYEGLVTSYWISAAPRVQ